MKGSLLFIAFVLPFVSSQDLQSCVTNIAFAVLPTFIKDVPLAGFASTLFDLTQCVLGGVFGECQLNCVVTIGCTESQVGAGQCLQVCIQQCDPTFANDECLNTGVDLIENIPFVGLLVTTYEIFTSCVVGWDWVAQAVDESGTTSGPDVQQQFCDTLQNWIPLALGCSDNQGPMVTAIATASVTATATATASAVDGYTYYYTETVESWSATTVTASAPGTAEAIAVVTAYATASAFAYIGDVTGYATAIASASTAVAVFASA